MQLHLDCSIILQPITLLKFQMEGKHLQIALAELSCLHFVVLLFVLCLPICTGCRRASVRKFVLLDIAFVLLICFKPSSLHRQFEKISQYCLTYSDLIPLSFVLGFYVNLVVKRWWEMFQSIPSTDTLALFVSNSIHGTVSSIPPTSRFYYLVPLKSLHDSQLFALPFRMTEAGKCAAILCDM